MQVIDVQELAHRNLQTALSERAGNPDRATAALIVTSERQAIITISAKGELFFSRRLDLPDGFMGMDWGSKVEFLDDAAPEAYTPVGEYVPDYAGNPFSTGAQTDIDRAQRVVAEVQRSLDLWDRTWSSLPLALVQVYAGAKSEQLAIWMTQELGQLVEVMDIGSLFPQFEAADADTRLCCMPLLGLLLRTENGKV